MSFSFGSPAKAGIQFRIQRKGRARMDPGVRLSMTSGRPGLLPGACERPCSMRRLAPSMARFTKPRPPAGHASDFLEASHEPHVL